MENKNSSNNIESSKKNTGNRDYYEADLSKEKNEEISETTEAQDPRERADDSKDVFLGQKSETSSSETSPSLSKESRIPDQEGEKTSGLLKWTFFLGAFLVGLFYVILLWILVGGNIDNPFFQILGVGTRDLKGTLLNFTDVLFSVLSLIFLILTLVRFFQWIVLEKNAEERQKQLIKTGIYFVIFVAVVGLWVLFRMLIGNVKVDSFGDENHMIITRPQVVKNLTAPVLVEFDIGTRLYQSVREDLVQQISWDFDNDGKIDATGDEVAYRFLDKGENNGRFPVTVRVEYIIPETREEKMMEVVREVIISNESVRANITADQESGPVPLNVEFSANGSKDPDGEIILYEWDLDGDGDYELSGDQQTTVQKQFTKVGNYSVGLRVTGGTKDMDEAIIDIIVGDSDQNLIAKINTDNGFEGMMPFSVTLDGQLSFSRLGDITRYEWFIEGESEPVLGRTIKRTFRKPGEYQIYLTVENDSGEKSRTSRTITVLDNQVGTEVRIKTTPASTGKGDPVQGTAPLEIQFDARNSTIRNAVEWRWDFENDETIDDFSQVVSHTYRTPGTYQAKLTIVDSLDREFTEIQDIVVEKVGTKAVISATPTAGVAPLKVNFDGSASRAEEGEIVSYRWYLVDETPFNYDANLEYVFRTVGTYPVKLKILTSEGETDETTTYIVVRSTPLKSHFDYTIDPENPLRVSFDSSQSKGTIVGYEWNFGDGEGSRQVNPTHEFPYPAKYPVTLQIQNAKGVISEHSIEIDLGSKK